MRHHRQLIQQGVWRASHAVFSLAIHAFRQLYAAWPDSVYLVRQGKLVYRSQLEEEGARAVPFSVHINNMLEGFVSPSEPQE